MAGSGIINRYYRGFRCFTLSVNSLSISVRVMPYPAWALPKFNTYASSPLFLRVYYQSKVKRLL